MRSLIIFLEGRMMEKELGLQIEKVTVSEDQIEELLNCADVENIPLTMCYPITDCCPDTGWA